MIVLESDLVMSVITLLESQLTGHFITTRYIDDSDPVITLSPPVLDEISWLFPHPVPIGGLPPSQS